MRRPRLVARVLLAGAALVGAAALTAVTLQRPQSDTSVRSGPRLVPRYTGVNLASGSFGAWPGIYGRDYIYPGARDAAPFFAAGMTAVRLPFRWERLQPVPGGPLDPAELRRIDAMIAAMGGFRLIVLDVHNYGSHDHVSLGTPGLSSTMLADLWTRLATRYRDNPRVAFGLMNEPIRIDAGAWAGMAAEAIRSIRATGARNLVLVPGVRWSGAHSWTKGTPSNADALATLRDPAGNMAFEMHQYVDGNSSGTGKACVAPGVAAARLSAATAWLRRTRGRGFLAEFGAPGTPECLAALGAVLDAMDAADDVWLGWTYWAAGPRWRNYPLDVQPDRNGPRPQMRVLQAHVPR